MIAQQIINRLAPADGADLTIPAEQFYCGYSSAEYMDPGEGWSEIEEACSGYRNVYCNAAERAIFTYCEGYLDLTIDADDATFNARLESAKQFYRRSA